MISSMGPVQSLELVLLVFLSAMAGISGVARKMGVSYAVVLVEVGLLSSLVPGIARLLLPPEIVFLVFLPPLLFAAAWQTSWREFRFNIISMSMLAMAGSFYRSRRGDDGAPVFAELRLAAWVPAGRRSFTNGRSRGVIHREEGEVPQRIVDVLEGESLLNDATGLLASQFGVAMIAHGTTPSLVAGSPRELDLNESRIASL